MDHHMDTSLQFSQIYKSEKERFINHSSHGRTRLKEMEIFLNMLYNVMIGILEIEKIMMKMSWFKLNYPTI